MTNEQLLALRQWLNGGPCSFQGKVFEFPEGREYMQTIINNIYEKRWFDAIVSIEQNKVIKDEE